MTPADVARLMQRYGETITLRRGDPPSVTATVDLKARVTGFDPAELVGDLKQGDRRVVIAHAELAAAAWPGDVPKLGDRAVIGGKVHTVMSVDTRKIGDEIAGHWMAVRG